MGGTVDVLVIGKGAFRMHQPVQYVIGNDIRTFN